VGRWLVPSRSALGLYGCRVAPFIVTLLSDLSLHTPADLARVELELNRRPRMILGDRTPAELFHALLTSQNHPQLR